MTLCGDPDVWLPLVFAGMMGFSILVYVVLDGFDLGVGILFAGARSEEQRDRMVASIGPFWDANETWLVLAVGILLVAFPVAHGTVLTALYLPVALMLLGLILRGVAFEFRAKAPARQKWAWDVAFFCGSLLTALSQGFMLGMYIMGLEWSWMTASFAMLTALCLVAGYAFIGACWLIIKTEDELQRGSVRAARWALWGVVAGIATVSIATPLVSPRILERWFSIPEIFVLIPLPVGSIVLVAVIAVILRHLPDAEDNWCWLPFAGGTALFVTAFTGLAYSFYPYVVPGDMTIYEAAAAPESLIIILVGSVFVLPVIIGYSVLAYTVFRGKASELRYD
ncbi:MAG: cytochrome d ubiquinol oxidase subunit II [Pseudomonadota bacterium]